MASIAEDRDEITQLLYRYNHLIDGGDDDAEGYADTFTSDGVFSMAGEVIAGRQALVEFAKRIRGYRHVLANPLVDVAGDRATVRAYLVAFLGTEPSVVGSYVDEVVRTPDGWRFATRVFTREARR